MTQHQKRHLNLQNHFAKLENLSRLLSGMLEDGRTGVTHKGRVKDFGGIKGVNIDYSFSFKNLRGNLSITNRNTLRDMQAS